MNTDINTINNLHVQCRRDNVKTRAILYSTTSVHSTLDVYYYDLIALSALIATITVNRDITTTDLGYTLNSRIQAMQFLP